jgi:lysophospholipase L1-like esterase
MPAVLQAHRPDVVLLHEGTNALTTEERVSLWATHLRTMVSIARNSNADVIIANILPVFSPHVTSRPNKPQLVIQLNRRIESIAQEFDIAPVVDLYSEFLSNRQLIGVDGLHPTRDGQTRMAEMFFAEIVRRYGVESQTLLRRPR